MVVVVNGRVTVSGVFRVGLAAVFLFASVRLRYAKCMSVVEFCETRLILAVCFIKPIEPHVWLEVSKLAPLCWSHKPS